MFELLTGASPFTLEGERNSQSEVSKSELAASLSLSRINARVNVCKKCFTAEFVFWNLLLQAYFALRSTVPLHDWTHCSGPVEEAVSERPTQEAGFWTTGG